MVAVGDQQLGVRQRGLHVRDRVRVADPPQAVDGPVVVGDLAPRRGVRERAKRRPRCAARVVVQREDGGEVGASGAHQPQAVLLRGGVGALVRPDRAGPVVGDPHPAEEAVAHALAAVRGAVGLGQRPQRGLAVAGQHSLHLPLLEQLARVRVRVVALGQVDLDHVVRAAPSELAAQVRVDHVVGRRGQTIQRPRRGEVVVDGAQWVNVGHGQSPGTSSTILPVAWRSSITRIASAPRASGKRCPMMGRTAPASIIESSAAAISAFMCGFDIT